MCPTPAGRVHTRVACMAGPALLALLLWLVTGRPDWLVLIGVFLVLGVALDSGVYPWAVRWQPPWMSGVLGLFELGLLVVLGSVLELDLSIPEAIALYVVSWLLFYATKIALLPIFSLTYLESAGEFRRTEWSIPASQEPVGLVAAVDVSRPEPGNVLEQASGAHAIPLSRQPELSGAHQRPPQQARGGS